MYYIINLMYTNSFKVDCELILITLTRSFLMESIHLIFERGLREEKSQTYPFMLSAKQGSIW